MQAFKNDSKLVQEIIVSEEENGVSDEEIFSLRPEKSFTILTRFYSGECLFTKDELLELIEHLNFFSCTRLIDAMILFKMSNKKYVFDDSNFQRFFRSLKPKKDLDETLCFYGCNEMITARYSRNLLTSRNIDSVFSSACELEKIELIKWILSLNLVESPFSYSCAYGKLPIIKFLYSSLTVSDLEMHDAFLSACRNGDLNVADWIYKKSIERGSCIDIHRDNESAYRSAVSRGHQEISEWLMSFGGIYISKIKKGGNLPNHISHKPYFEEHNRIYVESLRY